MKVYLETIGCRLNQSEIEAMARQFSGRARIVASAEIADMAVLHLRGDGDAVNCAAVRDRPSARTGSS
jgi:threonylcarbamoyladenosine tRNA methylthiotransferase MtaB